MKLKTAGILAGLALLLPSAGAFAHTDVFVGLGLAAPAPVYVEREPVYYYDDGYYYEPSRVYVEREYAYPRRYYAPRAYAYSYRHDRGYHRGWREHEWREHHGHGRGHGHDHD